MKLGVLDIGSNSIHMVLAELGRDRSFEVLGRNKDMTRLGDGTLQTGVIEPEKMERGLEVVRQFIALGKNRGAQRIIAFATAAIREASNGGEFLDRIQRETGVKASVVSGDEESRLIFLAARHFADLSGKSSLILDVGGGSVEVIVGNDRGMTFSRSLKLGVARLKDLFLPKCPPSKGDHERLHRHLRETLSSTLAEVRRLSPTRLVGTSGTLINLGAMISEERDDRPLVGATGFQYDEDDLKDLHERLAEADPKELSEIKGLDPDRKDLVLPGACLLLEVLRATKLDEVALCDRGIRDGVILDYMERNARKLEMEAMVPNVRMRTVLQLLARCETSEKHARQTGRLARLLFEQLPLQRELHPAAAELLEYSAILHDIGYHIGYEAHHRHGWYLIKNSEMPGFSPEEVDTMAAVVRYHRKRPPRRRDPELRNLGPRERRTVNVLTAVLRVADSLDRSHFSVVEGVRAVVRPKRVTLRLSTRDDPAIELWAARQKAGMLEEVLEREIVFEVSRKS